MSIANALNNAISGLTATSRSAEVVSSNLANALTPGYSRREIVLSPRVLAGNGGGVHVDGVSRIISDTVLADYRLSNAAVAKSSFCVGSTPCSICSKIAAISLSKLSSFKPPSSLTI